MPVSSHVGDNMYYSLKARYGGSLHLGDYLAMFGAKYPQITYDDNQFYEGRMNQVGSSAHDGDLAAQYWAGEALLRDAELWLDADNYAGGAKWPNQGTGGSRLDAQLGSTVVGWGAWVEGGALNINGTANNWASAPDSAALSVTGDLDVAVRIKLDDWKSSTFVTLLSKRGAGLEWELYKGNTAGSTDLLFSRSANGSTWGATTGISGAPFTSGNYYWVRLTHVPTTGATTFYWAPDSDTYPSSWTTLGTAATAVITPIDGANALNIGPFISGFTASCAVKRAVVKNGVAGSTVFDANFANVANNVTAFTESSANAATVTINRTAVAGGGGNYGTYIGNGALNLPGVYGNYASSPDSAALDITGSIELVARARPFDYSTGSAQVLIAKRQSAGQASFHFRIFNSGSLDFGVSADGTTLTTGVSTVVLPFSDGDAAWVKVTWDSVAKVARFYYAVDQLIEPSSWTQLGADVSMVASGIFNSTSILELGSQTQGNAPFGGALYRAIVRNGVGGTVVFDADFTTQPDGTTQFRESSSNAAVVTVNSTYNDTNDPLWLRGEARGYVYLPGVNGNYASTPDANVLDITGDIEIVGRCSLTSMSPAGWYCLIGKENGAGQRSYYVEFNTSGQLVLQLSADGTAVSGVASTASVPVAAGTTFWWKVTYRTSDRRTQFFTASDQVTEPSFWTQLGTDQIHGIGAIFVSTAELRVGQRTGTATDGKIYRAIVRNGIGGTTVFDADFSTLTEANQSSFVCQTGQTVTFNRAASGRKLVVMPANGRSRFLFGTDDYAEIADNGLLDFAATASGTMVAVVRQLPTPIAYAPWIAKRAQGGTVGWCLVDVNSTGVLAAQIGDGPSAPNAFSPLSTTADRGACLVALVVDRSAQQERSVVRGSVAATDISAVGDASNSLPVRIGAYPGAAYTQDFECLGVAVFRRALSSTELASIAAYYGAS